VAERGEAETRLAEPAARLGALPAPGPAAAFADAIARYDIDPDRIGAFGHSGGGFTALQTTHDDPRIKAAADLDGVIAYVQNDSTPGNLSTVAAEGLDRPFLLMGEDGNDLTTVPSWNSLWRHSTGPRRGLTLKGAGHATFTDAEALVPQIARRLGLPHETVVALIGTIAPRRAITIQRDCLAAFFGHYLSELPGTFPDVPLWHS